MDFLKIWNAVKSVPPHFLKTIKGGRLKGMSDISPIWRYHMATQLFGPCGVGWKYEIVNIYKDDDNSGQRILNIHINFYYKLDDEWSAAIPAIGGSDMISNESNGPYLSNEVYKMAITDALSVALKMMGFGADVYSGVYDSKYSTDDNVEPPSKIWLSQSQFDLAMQSDLKGIQATLRKFSGEGYAIKKEYRHKLEAKLKEML